MWKLKHLFMNAASEGGEGGGTGDGGNPGTGDGTSLLSTGAQNQPGDEGDFIPEKYRTNGEDGKFNLLDSSRKLADAYSHLSSVSATATFRRKLSKNIPRR